MACLIKPATIQAKGVLTLTTAERDRLAFVFDDIRLLLERVKQKYLLGLHHNWHDYALKYDELFDFHLAGDGDLREVSGQNIPLLPMDACNFSPACFYSGSDNEKFWDILFVARAVEFKGIPEFFSAIRQLFDSGKLLRILFICPLPSESGVGVMTGIRDLYESMFNSGEQELFTLLTTDFRYPFPFDLPTLAHFYRASRIFVHSAPDERRCRVASYAWACNMPVVGMAPVGSILTTPLRRNPYFFETLTYADFPEQIMKALEVSRGNVDFSAVHAEVSSKKSTSLLETHIIRLFKEIGQPAPASGGWLDGLDIRLGRHHGLPAGVNKLDQDISGLLNFLLDAKEVEIQELFKFHDPELEIAMRFPCVPRQMSRSLSQKLLKQRAMSQFQTLIKKIRGK